MALHPSIGYCTVTGHFIRTVLDGPDPDRDPDAIPIPALKITIKADLAKPSIRHTESKTIILMDAISVTTNSNGDLIGSDLTEGIKIIAGDNASLGIFTYTATIEGATYPRQTLTFDAPTGGIRDLSDLVEVPPAPGATLSAWLEAKNTTLAARDELMTMLDEGVLAGPVGPQGPAGPAGAKGDSGNDGPQGIQGVAGPAGVDGAQGVQGVPGAKGDTGATGATGIAGPTGATGAAGAAGAAGASGATGAQGTQGVPGIEVLYGDVARNWRGTSTAIPADQTVIWVHTTRPAAALTNDIWFEQAVPVIPAMSIVGATAHNPTALVTTRTIAVPAGVQDGDLIIVAVSQPGQTATTAVTGLTGLTLHKERKFSGNSAYVLAKADAVAADSGTTLTLTSSTALYVSAIVVVLRGASTILDSLYSDSASSTTTTPISPALVTTAQAFELQVSTRTGANIAGAVIGVPAGFTKAGEAVTAATDGGATAVAAAYPALTAQASGASFGGDTWTQGNSGYTLWTLALGVK